jgi:hypothetical protein
MKPKDFSNIISRRDLDRLLAKYPEDSPQSFKIIYRGNKKWIDLESIDEIDFDKTKRIIVIFKKNNPKFVSRFR